MLIEPLHGIEYITHMEVPSSIKQEANMADTGGSRGERLQIMLTEEELRVLDDFRFRKRMPSRASAIRELLKRGLAAEGFEASPFGAKSEDYGVIGSEPQGRASS
jgi:hypothetical protein